MQNRLCILSKLAIFIGLVLIAAACAPQTVEPSTTFVPIPTRVATIESLTATVIPTTAFPTQESTPTNVPIMPEATATIPVDLTPPQAAPGQIRQLDVVTTTFTVEGAQGIQYSIADSGQLVGMTLDGDMILWGKNWSLLIVDMNHFTARSLFENVRLPIYVSQKNNRIIFPLDSPSKQYPIWSVNIDGGEPVFLGTTTGYFPFFSATDDGKALVIENNHLVLKWIEDEIVQSQSLKPLEDQLGLDWSIYDLTQAPDYEVTPWIDFSISPDGQWVAVFDGNQTELRLATLDGQQIRNVPLDPAILRRGESGTGPFVRFSGWSPDSSHIAYHEGIWTNNPYVNYHQIKIVDTTGNQPIQITSTDTTVGGYLAWSADGQHIAFSLATFKSIGERQEAGQMGLEPQKGSDIFVANPDGSEAQKVSETHYPGALNMFWHPAKNTLLYICWNGDAFDVCTFDLD